MATDQEIRTALERVRKAFKLRPSTAQGTMRTNLRLEDGVKCTIRYGDWAFMIDEPTSMGGENTAPSPGVYGLSALAGCVAMSIKMQAAQDGVPINAIDVDVEADYDDRGIFAMDDMPPGFRGFRLKIDVDTPESEEKVRKITEQALSFSTWFHVFTHAQTVTTDVSVSSHAAAGAK
jgi:uncharacterized OsmC-like protein